MITLIQIQSMIAMIRVNGQDQSPKKKSNYKEKLERVDELVDELKMRHGT